VRFSDGLHELMQEPNRVLLEVGPGRTLCTLAKQHPGKAPGHIVLSSTPHAQEQTSDDAFVLNTVGQLWLAGVPMDWSAFHAGARRHRLGLPTYPFERKRYWIPSPKPSRRAAPRTPDASEVLQEDPPSERSHLQQSGQKVDRGTPKNAVEQSLAEIWREALGVAQVEVWDDFFELGGNSLAAVQVIARVRKLLGVKLSMRDLFGSPTISRLAETIEAASTPAHHSAGRPGEKDELKNALKRLECV
jgi:acyl transferase domain-containing protein